MGNPSETDSIKSKISSKTSRGGKRQHQSSNNQNRRAALGRPAMKLLGWGGVGGGQKSRLGTASNETTGVGGGGGLQLVCGRPTLALRRGFNKLLP